MGKIIGLDALQSAVQGKLEPIHKINTVTGTNGSITITDALDAPFISFTATGITPQVFSTEDIGAQMGEQTWDNPMCLDVPIGIVTANTGEDVNVLVFGYGNGIGSNNIWSINSGEDAGENVYYTSKDLIKLFNEADDGAGSVTDEGGGYRLFACPLPFSVAENSLVYCSHLKNQNVSGEEGIWASGNMLYLRIADTHSGGDDFGKLTSNIERIASNCNLYDPMAPVGTDPSNFMDFFIYLTASASYTKQSKKQIVALDNGTHTLLYLKISDYIALLSDEESDLTPIPQITAIYYTESTINTYQKQFIDSAVRSGFEGPAALGNGAIAERGGAVGVSAQEIQGGGAVGYQAKAAAGGAVGVIAQETQGGGAVGFLAKAAAGGAVGAGASSVNGQGGAVGMSTVAHDGGAVGYGAKTTNGCAIGRYAECKDLQNNPINAIQLGEGTNRSELSMQVYGYQMMDASGKIPYARLPQDEIEPAHKTQTVTTTNGTISISNALDAPLIEFSATGMGTPSVTGSVAMGSQTWDNPMVLDVPIGVVDSNSDALFLNYGGGIGSNTFVPTMGEETGNLIYYNSKQLANFFDYIDDQKTGTVTDEANSYELFTCNLPFAVEGGSTIYCSHLKNQNVSGEEGIWADGSTLYIRAKKENSGRTFEGFADRLKAIAMNCNFYDPYNPVGVESFNFQDFFIMFTASANYTKETDRVSVFLGNGSKTLYYFKITDYLAAVQETTPNPTLMSDISVTYYLNTEINQNQNNYTNLLIDKRFNGIASLGSGAVAQFGGAVGEGALENYGGFAGGYHAKASTGGAVGAGASTIGGQGGAVGAETTTVDGGAVGYKAKTSDGAAIGKNAVCKNTNDEPIDAIQLGTGTNQTLHSMKVYNTVLLQPRAGTYNYGLVIPFSLITESYDAASTMDKNDFDVMSGNIVRYSIANDLIGSPVGTFVKLTSNNTVTEAFNDGDIFIGQLAEVPMSGVSTALVRIKGVMKTEASLGIGLHRVAFSDGALDESANGREIFVTSSLNGQITFIV